MPTPRSWVRLTIVLVWSKTTILPSSTQITNKSPLFPISLKVPWNLMLNLISIFIQKMLLTKNMPSLTKRIGSCHSMKRVTNTTTSLALNLTSSKLPKKNKRSISWWFQPIRSCKKPRGVQISYHLIIKRMTQFNQKRLTKSIRTRNTGETNSFWA